MKSNPGGQIAPDQVFGRTVLVQRLWSILEGRSVYMNDARRIGKTVILTLLKERPPKGWLAVKRDLGGEHSAAEFATLVFRDAERTLPAAKRGFRRMKQLVGGLGGMEVAGILKLPDKSIAPWKEVLRRTFEDLQEELTSSGKRLVFLWDEVPFLLDNISRREGPDVAMEILDLLRALSQDHDRIRMVLTGSVGLHHILKELHAGGYIGSPLNTMEYVSPGPLEPEAARRLASALLEGESIACDDRAACAAAIADAVGYVAFYVHKLISRLPRETTLDPRSIDACLQREITGPDNDWDLAHYRTRIGKYYGADEQAVLHALDAIAARGSAGFREILRELNSRSDFGDEEKLRFLLRLLEQDHYLAKEADGRYRFRFHLIRRWWVFDRNLGQGMG